MKLKELKSMLNAIPSEIYDDTEVCIVSNKLPQVYTFSDISHYVDSNDNKHVDIKF